MTKLLIAVAIALSLAILLQVLNTAYYVTSPYRPVTHERNFSDQQRP